MSYRTKQIQTKAKRVKRTTPTTIGGQAPSGMTRYITFLMLDNAKAAPYVANVSTVIVYLASVSKSNPSAGSLKAVANRKALIGIFGTKNSYTNVERPYCLPREGPDPGNPLFTIAGSKWLGVVASTGSADMFMQWFDE